MVTRTSLSQVGSLVFGFELVLSNNLMANEMTSDEKEDVVLSWLSQQEADTLEDAFKVINLQCPTEKKGKKRSLIKFVLKHLCDLESQTGDDLDQGLITSRKVR